MQDIIERVQAMVAHRSSWDIREYIPTVLDQFTGDMRSKMLQHLAVAYERTATTGAEYRKALALAEEAASVAEQGGLYHTWALHLVASYSGDMGKWAQAERAGNAFFALLPLNERAQIVAPWVSFHVGRARMRLGDYTNAVRHFDNVSADAGHIHERAVLAKVWALASSGRVGDAWYILPFTLQYIATSQLDAYKAFLYYVSGEYTLARHHARLAVEGYFRGEWNVYDITLVAQMLLVLKTVATRERKFKEASVYSVHALALLVGWNVGVLVSLHTDFPTEGRNVFEEAVCGFGPAGHHRAGLLGAVG